MEIRLLKTRNGAYEKGLTLIEVMIALTLSLLLFLAVYRVVDLNQQAQAFIEAENTREDQAQLALGLLSESIRMADYWRGAVPETIRQNALILGAYPGACNLGWVINPSRSIFGMDGASSPNSVSGLPKSCLKKSDYLPGSDLIQVQFANSRAPMENTEIDNKPYAKHIFLRAHAQKQSVLFHGRDSASVIKSYPNDQFYRNLPVQSDLFFLKPCKPNKQSCFSETSILSRLSLKGDRYRQESLLENIEQMQIEYGVDENDNNQVDYHKSADKVTDWSKVIMVRLFLLVRNHLPDFSQNNVGQSFVMHSASNSGGFSFVVPEQSRFFKRKLYQRDVAIRNRIL